jgi:carbon-monoxide dehydrogenase large subunit
VAADEIPIPGSILGHSVKRVEDPRFITGHGEYCDDLPVTDGGLTAVFTRSPVPHARITGIDTSAAAGMPGVSGVFTDADLGLPANLEMPNLDPHFERPYLARDRVRFVGDPVAVVVAETRAQAADAAEAVLVDYDPLPAVSGVVEAFDEGAPLLFPEVGTNACAHARQGSEDEDVLEGADVVVRQRVINQRLAAVPMEPNAAVAAPGAGGDGVTLWVSAQMPHGVRDAVAGKLSLDPERVRVIAPDVGGGFGAKGGVYPEWVVMAALARRLGRQVRWIETRSENLLTMVQGRAQVLDVELAASREGDVTGLRVHVLQDAGAYPGLGTFLPTLTGWMLVGVYKIPRVDFRATAVATNTAPISAYRGAGRPEAAHLLERTMDLLAAELGMDPAAVRRRNFIPADRFPYSTPTGIVYDSGEYAKPLDRVLELAGYDDLRREQAARRERGDRQLLGIGLATYVEVTGLGGPSEHGAVELHPDGRAIVYAGTSSHGQGHATAYAQVVAERLHVPLDSIEFVQSDTSRVPSGGGTAGSRSLQMGGVAIDSACGEVLERGRELAAESLEVDQADLELGDGGFRVRGVPTRSVRWADLAARVGGPRGLFSAIDFTQSGLTYPFGAHVAVVEVDSDTGEVRLVRHVAVDDAGPIVNPLLATGQQHGGIAQGAAQALFEEVLYDPEGTPKSSSLIDYAMPTANELPSFETAFTVTRTPHNGLGVKGIGEAPTIGSTPAVHNAVMDALSHRGVRHLDMPLSPEKVWRALAGL